MKQRRSVDIRHGIADTLTSGASLPVRSLAYGTNLTSRTVLATLAEDGPTRLTALAVGSGVSQPALPLIEQLTRESAQQPRSPSPSAR
jgi:hypothetical protein